MFLFSQPVSSLSAQHLTSWLLLYIDEMQSTRFTSHLKCISFSITLPRYFVVFRLFRLAQIFVSPSFSLRLFLAISFTLYSLCIFLFLSCFLSLCTPPCAPLLFPEETQCLDVSAIRIIFKCLHFLYSKLMFTLVVT